jgi:hypothetical protein
MVGKPLDIPPEVAQGFVRAMRDFFAEPDPVKRDAIAAHQLKLLRDRQGPRDKKLRLGDVKDMFEAMREFLGD